MPDVDVEAALDRAEKAVDEGRSLEGTGFWKAVAAVKRNRSLVDRYADRIGKIDRRYFESRVRSRVPSWIGLIALGAVSFIGLLLVLMVERAPIAFLIGFAMLLIGTHSPAHWLFGKLFGMKFTHVFLGGPPPPRPGVKVDYATYLRATPLQRAVMHASGAVVTKALPFVLLIVSVPMDDAWLTWLLVVIGIGQIVTDITLSTRVSDWKKVKRELRANRS